MQSVLIIEDNAAVGRSIAIRLKRAGYSVMHVLTLADARQQLFCEHSYQWVLCDTQLPDGYSDTLHRELVAEGKLESTTFIGMSGNWYRDHGSCTAAAYYDGIGVKRLNKPTDLLGPINSFLS